MQLRVLHPQMHFHLIVFTVTATLGQLFIFQTIKNFGAVVFAITMNTRIILSILLSCFIYNHDVGASGYLGLFIVFSSIAYRIKRKMQGTRLVTWRVDSEKEMEVFHEWHEHCDMWARGARRARARARPPPSPFPAFSRSRIWHGPPRRLASRGRARACGARLPPRVLSHSAPSGWAPPGCPIDARARARAFRSRGLPADRRSLLHLLRVGIVARAGRGLRGRRGLHRGRARAGRGRGRGGLLRAARGRGRQLDGEVEARLGLDAARRERALVGEPAPVQHEVVVVRRRARLAPRGAP